MSYNQPDHSPENSTLSLAVLLMEVEVVEGEEEVEVMAEVVVVKAVQE